MRTVIWTLSIFCKGRLYDYFEKVSRVITSLVKVLIENDLDEILIACLAMKHLSSVINVKEII